MSSGYENAPIIQVLSILTLVFSTALRFQTVELDLMKVLNGEVWRLISNNFVFKNSAQLIVGLILLYSLRNFERQMGIKKFGAYLVYSLLASTIASILLIISLSIFGFNLIPSSGPYFLIFSLMSFYYAHIPALYSYPYSVLGFRLSEKSWIYLLAIQLLFSDNLSSIIAGISGMIVGYIYTTNKYGIQSYRLPKSVENVFGMFGNIFQAFSSPPTITTTNPNMNPLRRGVQGDDEIRFTGENRNTNRGLNNRLFDLSNELAQFHPLDDHASNFPRNTRNNYSAQQVVTPPQEPPSEDSIVMLMGLGFDREAVLRALQTTGNNLEAAANILLR